MINPFKLLRLCRRHLSPLLSSASKSNFFHTTTCGRFLSSEYLTNKCGESEGSLKETENEDYDDLLKKDNPFYKSVDRYYDVVGGGHRVLLVQPRVVRCPKPETREQAELKMDESVALIETLPDWKVIQQCVVNAIDLRAHVLFGKGNLEKLKQLLNMNPEITAVFIGTDMLVSIQNAKLQQYFGREIFDRYQIVLKIFHNHARTKEARLQTALAEIPYLRVKLAGFSYSYKPFEHIGHVGGSGETHMDRRNRLLFERELKLKRALEKVRSRREFLRRCNKRNQFPTIAVIGYTNSGKTTLIKTLTKDAQLMPEDKLFATLDVTLHAGMLPSMQKVLFIDTVGFISNIPTTLIQCFRATLEDILEADLIIHIRDVSHPDTEMQKDVVLKTLASLELPEKLLDTIIEVGNKVDLVENVEELESEEMLLISAKKGNNLNSLMESVEKQVILNMDYQVLLFRVPNGGTEYRWLLKEAAIRDSLADQNNYNYIIVEAVISRGNFAKFVNTFGDMTITVDEVIVS